MRRFLPTLIIVAATGLAFATAGHAAGAASLKTRHGKIGTFLVNGQGRTVYLFLKDKSTKSTCTGACAADWPPLLTTGKPVAGKGAKAELLGTTKRSDGTTQVTYNGHPLYLFAGDGKPGDTHGQGLNEFGARWYAVKSIGNRLGGY